jgi:hypothetical protein
MQHKKNEAVLVIDLGSKAVSVLVGHSAPSVAEAIIERSYVSTFPYVLTSRCLIKLQDSESMLLLHQMSLRSAVNLRNRVTK